MGKSGTPRLRRLIHGGYPCKNFVMIGIVEVISVSIFVIQAWSVPEISVSGGLTFAGNYRAEERQQSFDGPAEVFL